jgi:DnaJ-class molecular chaperone
MSKDYYKTLGVNKTASEADIKSAFRKLAHQHHPDKNGGDDKKFKEVNEAYQTLSNKNKRAQYDQFGSGGPQFGGGGNPFGGGGFGGFNWEDIMRQAQAQGGGNMHFDFGGQEFDLGDLFGAFAGGGRMRRGRDIGAEVQITFKESIKGVKKEINVPIYKNGKQEGSEKISIEIPAGIEHGERLRMEGRGESIDGGRPGNLIIDVLVEKHKTLRKEGLHLVMDLQVDLMDALLGKEIEIDGLDGKEKLTIPECMPVGTILKIAGKGVVGGFMRTGDLLIVTHITMPKKLSKDARKLVEELKKEI